MITTFQSIKLYLKFAECRKLKPILSNYSFLPVMLFYNRIILILILVQNIAGRNPSKEISVPEAGNKRVTEIIKNFKGRGTLADDTPPTPPEKAVKEFKVREGFAIELMSSMANPSLTLNSLTAFSGGVGGVSSASVPRPLKFLMISVTRLLPASGTEISLDGLRPAIF